MKETNAKISISLSQKLLEKVEKISNENGVTRSAAISMCLTNYFKQIEQVDTLKTMIDKMSDSIDKVNSMQELKQISISDLEEKK